MPPRGKIICLSTAWVIAELGTHLLQPVFTIQQGGQGSRVQTGALWIWALSNIWMHGIAVAVVARPLA